MCESSSDLLRAQAAAGRRRVKAKAKLEENPKRHIESKSPQHTLLEVSCAHEESVCRVGRFPFQVQRSVERERGLTKMGTCSRRVAVWASRLQERISKE
ncbi:hypothetical protein Tco_0377348 [Tanacetum coccineum]